MSRPKALDLFCGAGGASMGLYRAGFDVTGVDIRPQPNYPFKFSMTDALRYPLEGYDLIWASPPCQFASVLTAQHRHKHPNLIPATRARLQAVGVPYIIENVAGVIDRTEPSTQARRDAMDIGWMSRTELDQAIPPAYSEYLARQVIEQLRAVA